MHYQPIIEIASGDVSRVEAFCRSDDDDRGFTATTFIANAEGGGFIAAVTSKAVELVLADREIFGKTIAFSYNLSETSLRQAEFSAWFLRASSRSHIDFSKITLELRDGIQMRNDRTTLDSMERLRARGIRFSIDGFGLDLSHWSHVEVAHSGVVELKVHGDLVANLGKSGNDILMQSVLDIASRFELDVVAKNVETPRQLALAGAAGCRYAQGYAIARPMSATDLADWLETRSIVPCRAGRPMVSNIAKALNFFGLRANARND